MARLDLTRPKRRTLFLAVSALGVSAFVTQLTLMRELLSVFSGNELVFGIVLGNWLLLTGMGSYLGRVAPRLKRPLDVLVGAQVLVALLPIADVFALRALRNVVFIRGAEVGVIETVGSCFVLLAPYCLIAGFLLTLASLVLASEEGPSSIGQVYFLDNVGDVAGGLLFTFVLVLVFDHFEILYVPAFLNLLMAGVVAARFRRRLLLAAAVAATATLAGLIGRYDLDRVSAAIQYAGQHIVYQGNSPYGSLVVTESAGQYNFIENGVPLFSTRDVEAVEETVHYAMAQRPDAGRVLLISGGVSGTAREILKYGVESVDYVELDPMIVDVARRYFPESLADPRIEVIETDGRQHVRRTSRRYDVVLVDVPDPSTSRINRFYTREFFAEVACRLEPGGVLSISLGHYENYLSAELARLIAVAHKTLSERFEHVLMIPGGRIYFLASNGPLTADIADRLESRGIATHLVERSYLSDVLSPFRMQGVGRAVSPDAPVNADFSPILYYDHLRYWMSQFKVRFGFLQFVLWLMLGICLWRARPVSFAIFTTGLAASALEVVLLVAMQILYGCLYRQAGLIVTMFMLGLGIGSWTMNRVLPRRSRRGLIGLELGIALYAVCLPFVLMGLGRIDHPTAGAVAAQTAIPLLTLVLGSLVGLEFPLAGKVDFETVSSTAARLYTADYLGSALGALLVSTLLIPVLGVTSVCLLAAGLNLASGGVLWVSSPKR
jgi:spermidine synthase